MNKIYYNNSGDIFLKNMGLGEYKKVMYMPENLYAEWLFYNNTTTDHIRNINASFVGTCALSAGTYRTALLTGSNGYLQISGGTLPVATFSSGLTIEIWYKAQTNSGWEALFSLGQTINNNGVNYIILSPTGWQNPDKMKFGINTQEISQPWLTEIAAIYDENNDTSDLHQIVGTVNNSEIKLYFDGEYKSTALLNSTVQLQYVIDDLIYVGRSGWAGDPNWKGEVYTLSIYDDIKDLTFIAKRYIDIYNEIT